MKSKKISLIIIILIIIITIAIALIYRQNNNQLNSFYGTVTEIKNNYLIITPLSTEKEAKTSSSFIIYTKDTYKLQDLIYITYKGKVHNTDPSTIDLVSLELISTTKKKENTSNDTTESYQDTSNSSKETPSNSENSSSSSPEIQTSSSSNSTSEPTTTSEKETTEDDVIAYFNSASKEIATYSATSSFKEKAKTTFITLVDFLFYDGEIKNHKFKDLSTTAKLKVLNITFKIDNQIDSLFPDYKEELSSKYHDVKNLIAAKYFELTATICNSNNSYCDTAKEVWSNIKKQTNISWTIIKKYLTIGKDNIKSWYEVFSGKK